MAGLCGFEEDEVQFIILAVDEACTNVIRHAYGGRKDGDILLSCTARNDRIEFVLVDQGKTATAEQLRPRSLDELRPGGLGTYLIRSIMDEVRYQTNRRGNEMFLAKSLRPRQRLETGAVTE